MDFINAISASLGVDPATAQAVAGAALGTVQKTVAENADEGTAQQMAAAIPELGDWKSQAASLLGGGGAADLGGLLAGLAGGGQAKEAPAAAGGLGGMLSGLTSGGGGGLLGQVAGALGGAQARDTAVLVGALGKLGLDPSKAMMVAPIALNFLKERLSPELLSTVISATPMLAGLVGGKDDDGSAKGGGGLAGALGGLFG